MKTRPLRFCMVTTFYPPYHFGGDATLIYRLSNLLAERGHQVEIVHCVDAYEILASGDAPSEANYPHHENVTVHRLRSKAGVLSPLITQQTGHPGLKASPLRRILESKTFDVIHYHNISLIGPRALSYGSGIKLYTMHEFWLVCPMHVLWKFDREPCNRKQCFACTIHGKRPPQLWRYTGLLSSALKHVDAFIAVSRFEIDKLKQMGLNVEAPIVHLPSFAPEPDNEAASEDESPHSRPYFLCVGRLEKIKGVQVLIEAFRKYSKADLLIAGDGNYKAELQQQAQGLSHIHFLGLQDYDHLSTLYRHTIALLASSVGYETFPLVPLEALTQRVPVVVNNIGPLPELVVDSGAGFIYSNEAELLEFLERLRLGPELRKEMGLTGYKAYQKYWSADAHLRLYFDLIDQIATKKGMSLEAAVA